MRLRPISPRNEWEAEKAVADRMQRGLDGGCVLIWLDEVTNEIERMQIQTLAVEQIKARRKRATLAEKAGLSQYRR